MEKHAEAKITKASNLPDDIVIEPARGEGQILPNKKMNLMIALFLGLIIPLGFVWVRSVLNNSIQSQDDIEALTDNPVLGKIMHNRFKTKNVMYEFPNSDIAESIRELRTNLDFYVRGSQKYIILITSALENEGKSFIALNLAMSYAQLGRNTILVDCDLRKPKTYFREGEDTKEGLSSYMIDKASIESIILKSPNEKLDYITSGILPPNPVELLALDKTEQLLSRLKTKYDIIILDTTPLGQVTDAYLLLNHSDIKVVVARHGQTMKNVFSLIMKDLVQKKVINTCIVLNDNRSYRDQYGYGYGYYNKKGLFNRTIRKRRTSSRQPSLGKQSGLK
jgi:capsular exopolysaccharide synthesis family protein